MRASGERVAGLFDEALANDREEKWGKGVDLRKSEDQSNGKTDVENKGDAVVRDDRVAIDGKEEGAVSSPVMEVMDEEENTNAEQAETGLSKAYDETTVNGKG